MRRRWALAGRVVMAAVVLGNAVGLAANAAAAVHYHKAADIARETSSLYAANNTAAASNTSRDSQATVQLAGAAAAVQRFCEVAVLLLIIFAFVVVGALSARRFSVVLRGVESMRRNSMSSRKTASAVYTDASAQGRMMRLQIVGITGFVFVVFLLRSVFSTMNALAFQLRDSSKVCPGGSCDPTCQNIYAHMSQWMAYTPAFQLTVVLISSPVALLVALWGMTTKTTLQTMQLTRRERPGPLARLTSLANEGRKTQTTSGTKRQLPLDIF
jgi:hypothetical protein